MSFQVNGVSVNAPVGTIVAYVNNNLPNEWLSCDGQTLNVDSGYPSLYAFLGGTGPNTVSLPNLNRGLFLRGIGNNSYGNTSYTGPSGINQIQIDSIRDHEHTIPYSIDDKNGGASVVSWSSFNPTTTPAGFATTGLNLPLDEDETRPLNYGIVWIIKA